MKTEIESKQLLARYGIATTNPMLATSAKAATDAVRRLGKACALKVVSPDIVHKVDAGGVRLSVQAEQAADAYQAIMDACRHSHPDAAIDGVLIEEMVPPGLEVFIGAQVDRDYGVVVLVGPGGSGVEQRARPKAALAPLDKELALLLVDAAFPDKFAENAAGRETLARYLMAVAGPEGLMMREAVDELDINPVIVSGETAIAVDAVAGEASGARPVAPRSEKDIAEALARRRARLGGLGAIFDPKAIAFVGASTSKDKLGFQLIQTLVDFGFTGKDLSGASDRAGNLRSQGLSIRGRHSRRGRSGLCCRRQQAGAAGAGAMPGQGHKGSPGAHRRLLGIFERQLRSRASNVRPTGEWHDADDRAELHRHVFVQHPDGHRCSAL